MDYTLYPDLSIWDVVCDESSFVMFIKLCDNLQEKFYADFTSFPIISLGGNWDWALDAVAALSGKSGSQPRKPTLGAFTNGARENQGAGH